MTPKIIVDFIHEMIPDKMNAPLKSQIQRMIEQYGEELKTDLSEHLKEKGVSEKVRELILTHWGKKK